MLPENSKSGLLSIIQAPLNKRTGIGDSGEAQVSTGSTHVILTLPRFEKHTFRSVTSSS
jgi:hypothetical protein